MDEGDTAPVVGEGVLYIKKSLVQSNSWMEQVIFSVILDKRGSLSIVGVGFVKIPPQFYEKGPFYV